MRTPSRSPRTLSRRIAPLLAVALGAGLLVPSGTGAPANAADGLSLGPVRTLPEILVPQDPGVVSGTGTRFIVTSTAAGSPFYTPDDGKTWQSVPAAFVDAAIRYGRGESAIGYGGTFVGVMTQTDADEDFAFTGFQRWDPETGAVTESRVDLGNPENPEAEGFYPVDVVGTTVVLNDERIFDISGAAARQVKPSFAATPSGVGYWRVALARDGVHAVRAGFNDDSSIGYLAVGSLDGSAVSPAVKVPGLFAMDVSADKIHYLAGTSTRLRLCKALVTAPAKATCTTVAKGDYRPSKWYFSRLTTSAGADQILMYDDKADKSWLYLVTGGSSVRVPSSWEWLGFRDTTKPMAIVHSSATKLDETSTVSASGKAAKLFSPPKGPGELWDVIVSSGRVTMDADDYTRSLGATRTLLYRPLADDGTPGDVVNIARPDGSDEYASAARTAVTSYRSLSKGRTKLTFYDGAKKTGGAILAKRVYLTGLSGPYARLSNAVLRVDGHEYSIGTPVAGFGSLVVVASSAKEVAGRTFTVRDLARSDAAPITVPLPQPEGRAYGNEYWQMWGEWVVAPYSDADHTYGWAAANYRTGATRSISWDDGEVDGIGDGWVLLRAQDDTVGVESATVTVRLLESGEDFLVAPAAGATSSSTDGIRTIGWTGAKSQLVQVKGLPASAPRLLGALGATSFTATGSKRWKPQFDLTKAIAAGTLELRNAAGTVVRSLPTKADPMGSVRGLSWDGRDAAGKRVPAGTYTWTLVVSGADGTGPAVSVDGLREASGSLKVKR